jgi:hypothetical protein
MKGLHKTKLLDSISYTLTAAMLYIHTFFGKIKEKGDEDMSKKQNQNEPTIAPGMDDQEELEQNATSEEIENGEYTNVTNLSYDENDPS